MVSGYKAFHRTAVAAQRLCVTEMSDGHTHEKPIFASLAPMIRSYDRPHPLVKDALDPWKARQRAQAPRPGLFISTVVLTGRPGLFGRESVLFSCFSGIRAAFHF